MIKVKLLITGAYCVLNKGDAALRLGGLPDIKSTIPDAEFTILSLFPDIDSQIYREGPVLDAIHSPFQALNISLRCKIWRALHIHLGLDGDIVDRVLDTDVLRE